MVAQHNEYRVLVVHELWVRMYGMGVAVDYKSAKVLFAYITTFLFYFDIFYIIIQSASVFFAKRMYSFYTVFFSMYLVCV